MSVTGRHEDFQIAEIARMQAPDWMLSLLDVNPSYTGWTPGDDYMSGVKREGAWNDAIETPSKDGEDPFALDDMNVCANFYFRITRDGLDCKACNGLGYKRGIIPLEGPTSPHCAQCEGFGYFDKKTSKAQLDLVLWILHPRKGASRGVTVTKLSKKAAKHAIAWLGRASHENAKRFEKVIG